MTELGIDSAQIIGNSMGGFIGAELAIQDPARVERLVLAAAAGLSIESIRTERTQGIRHRAENVVFFSLGNLASRSHQVALRPRLRHALLLLIAAHPAQLPGPLAAQQVLGSGKPGFSDALEAMCRYPLRDRLEKIACPTLILWGDKDRLVPPKDASVFEKLIPDSRKVVYEDTGHVVMMERPARFNADVRAFLEEAPGEQEPAPQAGSAAG
jgi:pimeloyl-ACP methyl ester carboxylesterase